MSEKGFTEVEEVIEDDSVNVGADDVLEDLDDLDDVDFDLDEVENKIAPLALAETDALGW